MFRNHLLIKNSPQQEADAQTDQSELHRVHKLITKDIQERVLHLMLADFFGVVSKTTDNDDTEIEYILAVLDNHSCRDKPFVPGQGSLF